MSLFFDLISFVGCLFYFPYLIIRKKLHGAFVMRLGIIPDKFKKILSQKKNIWIHAVSVGEVLAVLGLIEKLKQRFPNKQIILTTVTMTGYALAVSRTKDVDLVLYAPLDFSFAVKKYAEAIRPQIYIVAETEIWPNLFLCLKKRSVPIVVVNGRISDRTFKRYLWIRGVLKNILACVDVFMMQSRIDADRITRLGALAERVHLAGNLKFDDISVSDKNVSTVKLFFNETDIPWVCGSTHPGEEEICLQVFQALSKEYGSLRLILAPRHPQRTPEIERLVERFGFTSVRLSLLNKKSAPHMNAQTIVIVDTLGELKALYRMAQIVFVGKSLTVGGGQNIIEPAFFAKPVLVGPLMQNFRDVLDIFIQDEAVIQVKDSHDLRERIRHLLANPGEKTAIGQKALKVVQKYQGSSVISLNTISRFLTENDR